MNGAQTETVDHARRCERATTAARARGAGGGRLARRHTQGLKHIRHMTRESARALCGVTSNHHKVAVPPVLGHCGARVGIVAPPTIANVGESNRVVTPPALTNEAALSLLGRPHLFGGSDLAM